MTTLKFKNALVSVSDKTGLCEFLAPLVNAGLRVVSTGGTAKHLRENGIAITEVSEQTGFPEVMDGRVRTLHPHIHMAILARNENKNDMQLLKKHGLEPFDLVIGNLYPFSEYKDSEISERELMEYVDIGGPALLRAAAKNFSQITVLCDPTDYQKVLEGSSTLDQRREFAAKVFGHTSEYDRLISSRLKKTKDSFEVSALLVQELRYGENPQQQAQWFSLEQKGLHHAKTLQGKALSYNNLLDIDAALGVARMFREPVCVAVKHNNPCGVSVGSDFLDAVQKCLAADPVSVFGGILAVNGPVDIKIAEELNSVFLECVIAPKFDPGALKVLSAKKNLRVLEYDFTTDNSSEQVRSVSGGLLVQTPDIISLEWDENWKIYGEEPSQAIKNDLLFSWKVCSALKSNAIAIASECSTLGLGMGQVNRVDSVRHAIARMKEYHTKASKPVLASDAFFPFPDSVEIAATNGIKWIIQPGGSIKDESVLIAAKNLGVNMVLTGKRHFRH